jgi:hypothetical protein
LPAKFYNYLNVYFKATLINQLQNIDFISKFGRHLINIRGDPLCPDSYCVLGENTVCQEDLEDFRPTCVSRCKLSIGVKNKKIIFFGEFEFILMSWWSVKKQRFSYVHFQTSQISANQLKNFQKSYQI